MSTYHNEESPAVQEEFESEYYDREGEEDGEYESSDSESEEGGGMGSSTEEEEGARRTMPDLGLLHVESSRAEFHDIVTVRALLEVLFDPAQQGLHRAALTAVGEIVAALGERAVPYLGGLLPPVLALGERRAALCDLCLTVVGTVALAARAHMVAFLPRVERLLQRRWTAATAPSALYALACLARATADSVAPALARLLPRVLLDFERAARRRPAPVPLLRRFLETLTVVGAPLRDRVPLLLPTATALFAAPSSPAPVAVAAISAIARLAKALDLAPHYPSIMHAVLAVTDRLSPILLRGSPSGAPQSSVQPQPQQQQQQQQDSEYRDAKYVLDTVRDALLLLCLSAPRGFAPFVPAVNARFERIAAHCPLRHDYREIAALVHRLHCAGVCPPTPSLEMLAFFPQFTADKLFRGTITPLPFDPSPSGTTSGGAATTQQQQQQQQSHHHHHQRQYPGGKRSSQCFTVHLDEVPPVDGLETAEDVAQWFYEFTLLLVRRSPSDAVRRTAPLVQACPRLGRRLFAQAFLALWAALDVPSMAELRRAVARVLQHPEAPPAVLQALLGLLECLEREERPFAHEELLQLAHSGDRSARALLAASASSVSSPLSFPTAAGTVQQQGQQQGQQQQKTALLTYSDVASAAFRCRAYAKALRAKEKEYKLAMESATSGSNATPSSTGTTPERVLEDLITINNELQLPDASNGVLQQAQAHAVVLHEAWYERLDRWGEALAVHRRKLAAAPGDTAALLGTLRCLSALGEYHEVDTVVRRAWHGVEAEDVRQQMAPIACATALVLGAWARLAQYAEHLPAHTATRAVFETVLAVHRGDYAAARALVRAARTALDAELVAAVGESYARAYPHVVRAQQLAELEEVCAFRTTRDPARRARTLARFAQRLGDTSYDIDTWQTLLRTQALAVEPAQNPAVWIRFAALCRKQGRLRLACAALESLAGFPLLPLLPDHCGGYNSSEAADVEAASAPGLQQQQQQQKLAVQERLLTATSPAVAFACAKLMWSCARSVDEYNAALVFLSRLRAHLCAEVNQQAFAAASAAPTTTSTTTATTTNNTATTSGSQQQHQQQLLASVHLKAGYWQLALSQMRTQALTLQAADEMLRYFRAALRWNDRVYKTWHAWAMINATFVPFYRAQPARQQQFLIAALEALAQSMMLGRASETKQQDALAFLKLAFNHCTTAEVEAAMLRVVDRVDVGSWLGVIPQIIARISSRSARLRTLTQTLLARIGAVHPQAVVYPLNVLRSTASHAAAEAVFARIRPVAAPLEAQVRTFAHELVTLGIFWQEMWLFGINEASRLCYDANDLDGMWKIFAVMYGFLVKGPKTVPDRAFAARYRPELLRALEAVREYTLTRDQSSLQAAWDCWFNVFCAVEALNNDVGTIDLATTVPELLSLRNLALCVPGTYTGTSASTAASAAPGTTADITAQQQQQQQQQQGTSSLVTIARIKRHVKVYRSKQRPRAVTIVGSNGVAYRFLLKGHEDIRQDERAMQFFGLVNSVLGRSRACARDHLKIVTYSVVPLSPNAGLIGWVLHSDTFHELVKEYREWKGIPINRESLLLREMTPFHETATLMQKVELLRAVLARTDGMDLRNVLWRRSGNTEQWLQQRLAYTRSLAVMSMVGHVLGIGDRHPSNLLLDRDTGDVTHIDFGDCFETAMHRASYPERIPFRLTRMLVNVMEASGVDGTFRATCERVMALLRKNRDTLLTVLETFVYDPLLTWKLLDDAAAAAAAAAAASASSSSGTSATTLNYSRRTTPLSAFVNEASVRTFRESQTGGESFMVHVAETPQNSLFRQTPGGLGARAPKTATLRSAACAGDRIAELLLEIGPSLSTDARGGVGGGGVGNSSSRGWDDDGENGYNTEGTTGTDGNETDEEDEVLNTQAVHVMKKVVRKLEGTEFGQPMDVPTQVQRLFHEAMDEENLAACYRGWCPFW